jgi:predicted  nucleic acid-binding Zn-ribbon protein
MTTLRDTLDSLLSLQAIDSQRDLLFRNLNAMDNGAKIVAESAAAEAAEAAARKTSQTTNSSLKAAELELESMEKKIQLLEKRISSGAIVNTKELLNNEKELSQLNRLRSTLDEKILGLMDEAEKRKVELDAAEAASKEKQLAKKTAIDEIAAKRSQIELELSETGSARTEAASLVPDKELLKLYETMRLKPQFAGVVIAKSLANRCGGCKMQVSSLDARRAQAAEEMVLCQNCRRIMA